MPDASSAAADATSNPDGIALRRRLAELPLDQLVSMLSGASFWTTEAIDAAGVPQLVLTDGPHGVRRQPADADHLGIGGSEKATCFPTATCLAASWDPDLVTEVGAAIGLEARSLGVGVLLGPGLNIVRHPGGGRTFEYFSEDPVVSGRLAAAMIRGVQSEGVGACPKHFVANNTESYRLVSDSTVDPRTLRELYLRGFEIAISEGAPWALMTSYNLVNGVHPSDDTFLLRDVLRDEWGFDGLVVTDWGGVNDRVAGQRAGLDLEMPSSGGAHDASVIDAVRSEEISRELVLDRAVTVAELAQRSAAEFASRPDPDVADLEHHRLARRAAAAGTVLLTNDGTLPLRPDVDVAVIGAFAHRPRFQGAGSSQVNATRIERARAHLEERITGSVRYSPGYDPATGEATPTQLRDAASIARGADVAVVFVGLPPIGEAEGLDRRTLSLPGGHDALVSAVCAANPNTVVVLVAGAPTLLPWADRPAAILAAHLGGQAAGAAIADVLLGDVEPSGRLTTTFPDSPVFPAAANFGDTRRQVHYREGLYVGYRATTTAGDTPRFGFGHGGSYTTFEWADIELSTGEPSTENALATVAVTVRNTGERAGSDVVQVYLRAIDPPLYRPDRELATFAKVHLAPGESRTLQLSIPGRSAECFDPVAGRWCRPGGRFEVLVAASAHDVRATLPVDVDGDLNDGQLIALRNQPGASGPADASMVADDDEFAAMLGRPIPEPWPVLPFTIHTVIDELGATRAGRLARAAFLKVADRQRTKMLGSNPDPVLLALSEQMIREAPLRFLVSMSGGAGSIKAFDGLTTLLSALRLNRNRSAPPLRSDLLAPPATSSSPQPDGTRSPRWASCAATMQSTCSLAPTAHWSTTLRPRRRSIASRSTPLT